MDKPCPLCGGESYKALYMGIPVRLCKDSACSCTFGPWSQLMYYVPFNGIFLIYECSYLGALWHFLTTPAEEDT